MALNAHEAVQTIEKLAKDNQLVITGLVYPRSSVIRITDTPKPEKIAIFAGQPDGCAYGADEAAEVLYVGARYLKVAGDSQRASVAQF